MSPNQQEIVDRHVDMMFKDFQEGILDYESPASIKYMDSFFLKLQQMHVIRLSEE